MLQNTGGNLTRRMVTSMMAVFPTATFHTVQSNEIVANDVRLGKVTWLLLHHWCRHRPMHTNDR